MAGRLLQGRLSLGQSQFGESCLRSVLRHSPASSRALLFSGSPAVKLLHIAVLQKEFDSFECKTYDENITEKGGGPV